MAWTVNDAMAAVQLAHVYHERKRNEYMMPLMNRICELEQDVLAKVKEASLVGKYCINYTMHTGHKAEDTIVSECISRLRYAKFEVDYKSIIRRDTRTLDDETIIISWGNRRA